MKKKCIDLKIIALLWVYMISAISIGVFPSTLAADEALEAFRKNQTDSFQSYKKSVTSEFELYKTILDEEFNKYKNEVEQYWVDGKLSERTVWVEYSKDYKSRKIIDYDKGIIVIEQVVTKKMPPEEVKNRLTDTLTGLATQTTKTAYEQDVLSNRIEERMVAVIEDIKVTDSIAEVPVAAEMITGKLNPDKEQVQHNVKVLQDTSEITESTAPSKNEKIISMIIKIPDARMKKKALKYAVSVEKHSKERKLDPALVFAIMQTESSFNPMAKSYVPAYGLMQIVPRSAGKDAAKLVYGKAVLLAPSFLYDCDNNIKMGTAYLNVLMYRYLRHVSNPKSREYCAIAAYNTGTGNVARTFIGRVGMRDAAAVINKMEPEDVYNKLISKLPYVETRNYLKKVKTRMKHYDRQ